MYMRTKQLYKDINAGFGLTELIISLCLTGFLLVVLLTIMTDLIKSDRRLLAINQLSTAGSLILQQISDDLRWQSPDSLIELSPPISSTQMTVYTAERKVKVKYEYKESDAQLYKNDQPIFADNILVEDFEVSNLADEGHLPLINIRLTLSSNRNNTAKIVMEKEIMVSNLDTDLDLTGDNKLINSRPTGQTILPAAKIIFD